MFGASQTPTDNVDANDISFGIFSNGNRYDIIMYLKKTVSPDTQKELEKEIFGESVFVKQIRTIQYRLIKDVPTNAKTIEEARAFFGIKEH